MKKLIITFLLSQITLVIYAQRIDYNTIILPKSAEGISFPERLVQLAWQNNPANRIVEYQTEVSKREVTLARWDWLNNIGFQGNLNEFVLDNSSTNDLQAQFFPKYNIFATISLGTFVKTPTEIKKRKYAEYVSQEEVKQQKLAIRAEVLRRYYNYQTNKELFNIEVQALEDSRSTYDLFEQKFQNGEATLAEYNTALGYYNGQRSKKIMAQGNLNQAKATLEEIIGVKIEDVQE